MTTKHSRAFVSLALLVLALVASCGQPGTAAITIRDPWANATPVGATVAAVYLELTAGRADTLLSATTTVADRVEMHTNSEEAGMMRMRPLSSVDLEPGKPFTFAPGGAHFMLVGLRQPLAPGMRFPMTLNFKNAGTRTAQVEVVELGSR